MIPKRNNFKSINMTRAKFTCTGVTKSKHWQADKGFLYAATFIAVTSGSEENKSFFEASPNGQITLSTVKEDVFEPGKNYYIDFTPAE